VYDLNDAEGLVYLSMEYLEGKDLRTRIVEEGPLPIDDAIDIACQVCAGLSYAHASGVVHRDIKPHNVFITSDGRVKLLDFGLAKAVDSTQLSSTGQMLGTPLYMAPEQAAPERGEVPDHRADLYSLGVVLYQTFTGMPPFQGTTPVEVALLHLKQEPQPPREIRPELPEHVEKVILQLLAKNRDERPADAAEVIPALRGEAPLRPSGPSPAGGGPPKTGPMRLDATFAPDSARRGKAPPPPAKRLVSRPVWIGAVALVAALGVGGLVMRRPKLSTDERVEQLFFVADGYFEKGQLVEPKGRNALEPYREILKLQPLNHKAIDRIQEIFESLVKQTNQALDRAAKAGDAQSGSPGLAEASKWFADARGLNPEDPAIADLAKRIDQITVTFAERSTERTRLAQELDQADHWMGSGQLVRPVGANALEAFKHVLEADPSNTRAQAGIDQIAASLKSQARAIAGKEPYVARDLYQQAREAAPTDKDIPVALAEIDKQIESREMHARQNQTVDRLLNQAREHLAANKLVRPQGDSAVDKFRQVLAMAPHQAEAEKGLADIAAHLVATARQDAAAGHLEVARQNLTDALEARPDDPEARNELAKIGAEIQRAAEDESRHQRVAAALARADGLRTLGQLVEPENANALDAYRAVLDLDPDNAAAKDALIAIREQLAAAARNEGKAGHLEEARVAYGRALKAAPGDTALAKELAGLEHDIETQQAAQAATAKAIRNMLTQAEGLLLRNQLTLPPDRNALDTYRKVLATDPGNAKALSGLADLAQKLETLGDEQLAKGNSKSALAYYQKAVIKERGDDPGLAGKIRDTQARIAKEDQAAAAAAAAPPIGATVDRDVARATDAFDAGQATEAITWLDEARGLDGKSAAVAEAAAKIRDALVSRATEAANRGDWDEALRSLKMADRATPNDATVASHLARAEKAVNEPRATTVSPNPDGSAPTPPKRNLPPQYIPTF